MSVNPFLSLDRQNFPAFSPMFKKKTPPSTEKNSSFRWSIDHIARLKPAEIDIDPATLVKTNGHSPAVDSDAEKASENFFAQKTILPSPWTAPVTSSKLEPPKPLPPTTKKVTFSPLPPTTAFISEESLVESEIRDNKTTDAGTQTLLTFPVNFDLYQLLGPGFNYLEEKSAAAAASAVAATGGDLGNSSLRRKLFGQPDRQGSISLSSSLSSDGGDDVQPAAVVEHSSTQAMSFTPLQDHLKTPVSKQPVHPSTSPSNPLFSSAIVFDADTDGGDPAHSSMIIGLHDNGPPDISPINIGCGGVGGGSHDVLSVRSVEGEGVRVSCEEELSLLSVEMKEKEGVGDDGREQPVEKVQNQQKFPSTHSKDVHMQSLPCLSPICGMGISPMPVHMLHQQSPFLHHHGNISTPAASSRVKVPHTTASGKATCTSTPNTTALKRQLVASPFASPVLKQPCTKRLDILEEDSAHAPPPNHHNHQPHCLPSHSHRDMPNNESNSESSVPQPPSLAGLGTETYELTSITPTTCTSDFAQFGLDDQTENVTRAENDRPHPLHSTAAGHMTTMSSIWNPPIHSTMMADSHCCKVQGSNHLSTKPIPQVSLPLVGGLSRIQSHSHSTTNGTNDSRSQSAIVADSGVAASGEFNFNNTAATAMASMALHGSNTKVGESGITVSGSDPVLKKMAKTEENLVGGGGGGAKAGGSLSRDALLASKLCSRPDDGKNGPALMAIREGGFESKGGTKGKRGAESCEDRLVRRTAAHYHSEIDSGLVFSPEHYALEHIPEEQPAMLFRDQRTVPTSERTKFHHLSPSVGNEFASDKFNVHHLNTPSRHSNLEPGTGFMVPMSPASYHHHHHHHHGTKGGVAPGMINNGQGGSHFPAFSSSRLTSKCTGLSSGAVLPSRVKLSSANAITAGLKSPSSYMYSSFVPPRTNYRGKENSAPLSSLGSPDVFGVGGASSKTTPTSRYSGKGTLKGLSGKSNLGDEMDEVIRKKEIVKARLQFTSPIDSPSMIGSSCGSGTSGGSGGGSSFLLRSPVSTRTVATGVAYTGRPRIPLCDASLNRPRSPLTRWNKEGFSTPFSASPLPSQLSSVPHHAHPFVVKSPWQPPISLSPVDGYTSRRTRLKLSST